MLTRRDKLLNRPWQLRRYNNHRKKVLTALPAIDFGPPAERRHVTCKLKKLQKEGERRHKIEEENFKLLQRMGDIMRKNRLENHWETPLPTFLHRVGIYHRTRSPTPFGEQSDSPQSLPISSKRKGCAACTPPPAKPPNIPEERVPWPPPRPRLSRRLSISTMVQQHSEFDILPQKPGLSSSQATTGGTERAPSTLPSVNKEKRSKSVSSSHRSRVKQPGAESRIVLKQGALRLSVNFPSDAEVKIISQSHEDIIQATSFFCKSTTCEDSKEVI